MTFLCVGGFLSSAAWLWLHFIYEPSALFDEVYFIVEVKRR